MSDADHSRSTTGLSPRRKQQRAGQASSVRTRGRVPVLSPDPGSAAAATCSPAGPVGGRHRGVDDEVGGIYFVMRASLRVGVHARGMCAVVAVIAKMVLDVLGHIAD
jgi:hypothetical protein